MSQTILKLKVDGREFDANIKSAVKGMQGMEQSLKHAGKSFKDASKDSIEYVRSLGKMETKSNTVRGKVGELSKAYTELRAQYNRLTAEEKRGDFGKALNKSLEQLRARVHEARTELNGISRELSGGMGNMGGAFNLEGLTGGLTKFVGTMGFAISAAGLFKEAISNNISTAMEFEKSMSKLSSLTGMVGNDLETLKRKAIELGSTTTQSASQAAEAMATIGSKRPDLLSSAYALSDVTKAAITMSEAAGMEVPEAAESLAAALNIFQMESSEAERVINVLAAGSKIGAAGIQELGDITFRAGGSAKKAGLSFEEFVGVAELIRPAFGSSEDAGQAFSKFLSKLEEKMDDDCKPSVVGFAKAMENLEAKNLSANESLKTFTVNGVKAYDAIMANVDGVNKLTAGVTNTNTATEQAAINTDNLDGSMKSLSSAWEGFNLALNNSNGALKTMVDWLTNAVTWATNTFTQLGRIKSMMSQINYEMGNGKTRNDVNLQYVGNGKNKTEQQTRQKLIVGRYNQQINELSDQIYKAKESLRTMTDGAQIRGQLERIKMLEEKRTAMRGVRDEFNSRATEQINNRGKKTPTTPVGGGGSGDDDDDKKKKKNGSTKTPKAKKTPKPKVEGTEEYWSNLFDFDKTTLSNLKLGQDAIAGMMAELQKMPTTKTPFDYITEGAGSLSARIDEIKDKLKNGDLGFAEYERLSEELKGLEKLTLKKVDARRFAPKDDENKKTMFEGFQDLTSGMSQMVSSMEQLGIDLPEGISKGIGVLQAISGIVSSILTIVTAIEAINAADAVIPLHTGGLVHAANGVFVPGASNGGRDTVRALLSPGELVLNAAQQSNLATQLQAGAQQRYDAAALGVRVRGEDMYTCLDNYMRRSGKRLLA